MTPRMTHNANGSWYCEDCKKLVILFDDDTHFCHEALQRVMEFDSVIEVMDDFTIRQRPDLGAPTLSGGELDSQMWRLLAGYSGQDRYDGPIMHASEYIGGRLADDILETPGVYVAVVAQALPKGDGEYDGDDIDGWAIATHKAARH